jgi:hypothetical protein
MSYDADPRMIDCVTPRLGMRLVNVKFFRGDRDLISAGELRAEAARVAGQIQEGDGLPPRSNKDRVNVRELVSHL